MSIYLPEALVNLEMCQLSVREVSGSNLDNNLSLLETLKLYLLLPYQTDDIYSKNMGNYLANKQAQLSTMERL